MDEFPPHPPTKYAGPISPTRTEASFNKDTRPDAMPPKEALKGIAEAARDEGRYINDDELEVREGPMTDPEILKGQRCGCEWDGNIRLTTCKHHRITHLTVASSPSDAAQPIPSGWVSYSTIQYDGKEYAIVWQRDRPFLCCRINGRWIVEHVIGHPEDAPGESSSSSRCPNSNRGGAGVGVQCGYEKGHDEPCFFIPDVEDVPEGPWELALMPDCVIIRDEDNLIVRNVVGMESNSERIAVRDALNRDVRDRKEGKT